MILHKESTKNDANITNENNGLMLKMVTSYSIFLLVIMLLFAYSYFSSIDNMEEHYNLQNESTFQSSANLFEKDLDIMNVYCRQLLQNSVFRRIMLTEDFTATVEELGQSVKTTMATDVYPDALLPIKEVYCYLLQTNTILSPSHFVTKEKFYNWLQKYPSEEYGAWLATMTDDNSHNRFLDMSWLVPNSTKEYFLYIVDMNDLYYMDAPAVVCFVIDVEELSLRFECISDESSTDCLYVTDADNNVILSLGDLKKSSQQITQLDYSNGFASFSKEITIGKYFSETTGYTYYYSFPSFASNTYLDSHHKVFLFIAFIAIAAGAVLVIYFSRRNVAPIIELGQELHDAVEVQNQLQEMVDHQKPIICRSYIRQLLNGAVTKEEEASYILNYMGLNHFESPCYNILYAVVYNNFEDSLADSAENGEDTSNNLDSIIHDTLFKFFDQELHYYVSNDRTYSILLPFEAAEEDGFILKIQEIVRRMHEYLLETYGIWLFAGIGKNTNDIMNIWESYQQAMEAVSYTTKNYIFLPYEMIKKDSNVFYYPPELSTKMIHFITTGNTAQVLELFNLIHEENIEERSLPINLIKFLLSDIRNTLLKARFALPNTTDSETTKMLDERFNEPLTFQLCEDLALALCKLFVSNEDEETLASSIERYITANFKDPSLCLSKISDEFQISESYFSHMFKEKTGVNFSTYLEKLRMTEAVRLIKETDISLNELYIAVGYNNLNTFRRAFKKIYGVTPSSMR